MIGELPFFINMKYFSADHHQWCIAVVLKLFKAAAPPRSKIFFNAPSLQIKIIYLNNEYKLSV